MESGTMGESLDQNDPSTTQGFLLVPPELACALCRLEPLQTHTATPALAPCALFPCLRATSLTIAYASFAFATSIRVACPSRADHMRDGALIVRSRIISNHRVPAPVPVPAPAYRLEIGAITTSRRACVHGGPCGRPIVADLHDPRTT